MLTAFLIIPIFTFFSIGTFLYGLIFALKIYFLLLYLEKTSPIKEELSISHIFF